jgi:hypothetical protein
VVKSQALNGELKAKSMAFQMMQNSFPYYSKGTHQIKKQSRYKREFTIWQQISTRVVDM